MANSAFELGPANTLVLQKSITQNSHGFAVGEVLYLNGGTYTKAIGTSAAAAEAVGMVTTVTSANVFTISFGGYINGLSGLTAGTPYYVSDSVAGALTATEPTTPGNISKPVLIADTTTSGYFFNMRGKVVPGANGLFTWSGISSNTSLVANTGYYITGGGALTLTLPTTAAAGTVIWIQGNASTSWSIVQGASQSVWVGNVQSTVGVGGSVASSNAHDGIYIVCTSANTTWQSTQFQGFLTVT